MSDDLYLQHLQSLEARRYSLLEALARLQQQRDLEENVKQQMQQEQAIAENQSRLRQLDEDIAQHGLREARKYRLKQSYSKALGILRYVVADTPDHPEVGKAITELEALEQQGSKFQSLRVDHQAILYPTREA
jgi:vacuolar-type H+-ATPase subunit I/STV1